MSCSTASISASASCFPFVPGEADRDIMMNTVAPVWDGNETWLVLGGGGLLAVFPLAYATVSAGALSADHPDAAGADLPRRRVRVPLRTTRRGQFLWDWAFAGGSTLAAFCRGSRWRAGAGHPSRRTAPMPAAGGIG